MLVSLLLSCYLSLGPLPCDSVPLLNQKIIGFVDANMNKKVGRGECWDLAAIPLNTYHAKWNGKFTYGIPVDYKTECVYPGDIIQFENVMIETRTGNSYYREEMAHHTAVVHEVHGTGNFTVAHQNYNNKQKVVLTELNLGNIKRGKVKVYRPDA